MTEEVGLRLNIEGGAANKTVREIKQEIKEINNELLKTPVGSKSYNDLAKSVAAAKEQLKDLREDVAVFARGGVFTEVANVGQTIAGGFAAAQGAVALFGDTADKELERTMLKVQGSIAVVEGVRSATQGWESVQRLLNLALAANPIGIVTTAIVALGAAIYGVVQSTRDDTDEWLKNNEAIKSNTESRKNLEKQIEDLEVDLMKEQGILSEADAKKIKQQNAYNREYWAIEQKYRDLKKQRFDELTSFSATYFERAEQTQAKVDRANAELNKRRDEEQLALSKKFKTELSIEEAKAARDKAKAADEEHAKEIERIKKRNEDQRKLLEELRFTPTTTSDSGDVDLENQKKVSDEEKLQNDIFNTTKRGLEEKAALEKRIADGHLQYKKEIADAEYSIAQISVRGIMALTELAGVQGEEAIAFQKGLALAQIAIDTAKAISALTAASSANPYNSVTFGSAGVVQFAAGIVQILANVAQAKRLLDAVPGGGSVRTPSVGSASAPAAPTIAQQTTATKLSTDKSGNFTGASSQQIVKAYVVESELTSSQKNVASIVKKSKIG